MSKSSEPDSTRFYVQIYAYGLSLEERDAMFDRIADAAHALDEQVTCTATANDCWTGDEDDA